ncbi:MAG: hypothetical protein G01um101413_457 [Parcubacteria group bacterium Gr01-1014_13]|nr:MAG: hypothetical protein G01um101413_457 [Parcubacteria group bacterium Gr01-1014_13]
MCFSATASFVAGSALSAVGVATITKAKGKAEIPFAAIPLLFGIQQIIEGVIWLSFGSPLLNTAMTYAYSIFSHVLWPIFIPFSILLLETDRLRKKILYLFFVVGLAVGMYLLYFILADPVTSQIVNNSIAYLSPHLYPLWIVAFYVVVTCGSAIVSKHKIINIFGITLFVAFVIAGYFFNETFFSVWCFFAAILSVLVFWYFKRKPVNNLATFSLRS